MRSNRFLSHAGRMASGFLPLMLILDMAPFSAVSMAQIGAPSSLEKTKSVAEAQHEIVGLLVQKKDYEKAAAEADKIFDMNWPDNQEPLLVKELGNLAELFLRSGQAPLGLKLIERNLKHFKKTSSQAALWKEMGYLHKKMNQVDDSLDCFKKARDLEEGR